MPATIGASVKTGLDRDADFSNLSIGPKFTFRHSHFSPFLEVLAGDQRLYPEAFHHIDKLGVHGWRWSGCQPVQAFCMAADQGRLCNVQLPVRSFGHDSDHRSHGVRLQTGLVFMFGGGAPTVPPSAACSVQPSEVFAGEPVTATASGSNFNPKRTVKYALVRHRSESLRQQRFHPD